MSAAGGVLLRVALLCWRLRADPAPPGVKLQREYIGTLNHPDLGRDDIPMTVRVTTVAGSGSTMQRGYWLTQEQKFDITIKWKGAKIIISDGDTVLEGTVDTQVHGGGVIAGIVIQNKKRGGSFRLEPQPPCEDLVPTGRKLAWYDARGENCAWYGENNACKTTPRGQALNFGLTAQEVCCVCGGGVVKEEEPTPPPPGVKLQREYLGTLRHPKFGQDDIPMTVRVTTVAGSGSTVQRGYWLTQEQKFDITIKWRGPKIIMSDGDTVLEGNVDTQADGGGVIAGIVIQNKKRGGSFRLEPQPPCEDLRPTGREQAWYDTMGENCAWYLENNACKTTPKSQSLKNFGLTAQQACCACGGGTRGEEPAPPKWPYASARVTGEKTLTITGESLPEKGTQIVVSHFPYLAWVALNSKGKMRSHNDCPHMLANTLSVAGGNWSEFSRAKFRTYSQGKLQNGADLRDPRPVTLAEASRICANDDACAGFTYKSEQKKPTHRVIVWFKSAFKHQGAGGVHQGWHSWKFDSYGADNECRNACRQQVGEGQELDPWCVLDLHASDSNDQIKRKYKELAKKYHPDKHKGSVEATAKFRDIQDAWETLREPHSQKRRMAWQRHQHRRTQKHPYLNNPHVTRLTKSTIGSLVFAKGGRDAWFIHMFNQYDEHHRGMNSEKKVPFSRASSQLDDSMHFGAIDCYDWKPIPGQQQDMTKVCSKVSKEIPQRGNSDIFFVVPSEGISVRYEDSLTGDALMKFARTWTQEPNDVPVVEGGKGGLPVAESSPQLWLVTTSQKKGHVCESCPVAMALFKRSGIVKAFQNVGILDCSRDAIAGDSTRPPALACSFGRPNLLLVSDLQEESCAYCYHEAKQVGCIYSQEHRACTTVDGRSFCRNSNGDSHVESCFQRDAVKPLMPANWKFSLREFSMALHVAELTAVAVGNSSSSCPAVAAAG